MPETRADRKKAPLVGVILIAIALVPRMHGLATEYVDVVEFLTMIQAPDTPLLDYLWRLWQVGPDQVPVYYVFTWAVREVFGYSWLVTRFASLVLMLSVLLIAWRFVANRFGEGAGFLAGLLLALSPADIYYAIQARSYSLVIFQAAISMWALVRAVETGKRRWWVLHLLVNNLLPWTHLFGFLLIAAEGLWLLGVWYFNAPAAARPIDRARRAILHAAAWSACHLPAIVLALAWLLRDTAGSVAWYVEAPLQQIFTDILGDAMFFGNLFVYESTPGQPVFQFSAHAIRSSLDYWLVRTADIAVALGFVVALIGAARQLRVASDGRRQLLALLFIAALLPPIVLYLAAALTIPVALPRYTAYCNFPLYMLLGIGLASLTPRAARHIITATTCVALAVLCATWDRVSPEVDWPGVVKLVQTKPERDARVIALSYSANSGMDTNIFRRMMEYSDPDGRERYRHAYTNAGAVDACAVECARTRRPVYLLTYALPGQPEKEKRLLAMLREAGFRVELEQHQYFGLYTVHHENPPKTWLGPADGLAQRYLERLRPIMTGHEPPQERINAALRWAVEEDDDIDSPEFLSHATLALMEVCIPLSEASAKLEAAVHKPSEPLSFPGILLALVRRDANAVSKYANIIHGQLGDQDIRPIAAVLRQGDIALAREIASVRRYQDGVKLLPVLLQVLGLEERLPYADSIRADLP